MGGRETRLLGDQSPGRLPVEPTDHQGRDALVAERGGGPVPHREEHHHAVGLQPARGEQQRIGGGCVEPVCVVDDDEHRLELRGLGQHRQGRDRHEERVDPAHVATAECGAERVGLRGGDPLDQREHGPQETVEGGEGERGLGLQSPGPQDQHPARGSGHVVEQRGLADAGIAMEHQGTGPARTRLVDEREQRGPFDVPPVQHVSTLLAGGGPNPAL